MKKAYFIVNLIAGKAMIADKLGKIVDELTKASFEVTVHTTQSSTDAAEAAEYACANDFDLIICAGGDGTLSQCIQGIMKSENRIPVGYIPAGSTNDFAKTLGIPKDIMSAVRLIINGRPVACDVGGFNKEFFSYIVAFGVFTNISYETPQNIKNVLGHAAYFLNGLMQITNIRSKRMRVEYDGNVIEDDFIFGMVSNTASVAGMLSMKEFVLDDGLFEVMLIKKPSNPIQLRNLVRSVMKLEGCIDKSYIKFFKTNRIRFTSIGGEPVTWTRDGEYGGNCISNTIVNNNRAISFIVNHRIVKISPESVRALVSMSDY
ncbi:MAG: YegS/Rv2252/BmrU family lipid kinase [Ruminococcus sp.]|nr:YegS/Rv2252/BmrU family lipid kinase [Ruminococcus sp.]